MTKEKIKEKKKEKKKKKKKEKMEKKGEQEEQEEGKENRENLWFRLEFISSTLSTKWFPQITKKSNQILILDFSRTRSLGYKYHECRKIY